MLRVNYNLQIGTWSVNSVDDPRTEFIALETNVSLNSPDYRYHIFLYNPPAAKAGLLEEAAAAALGAIGVGEVEAAGGFSVQVRGTAVKYTDQLSITLTSGELSDKVMTAEVESVHSSLEKTAIRGRSGIQKLVSTRINQVYENQSADQIVTDLASQAEVQTGEIESGRSYPYFVVNESKNLWNQIRELARREGMDVYFDTDNKLNMKKFNKTRADHTFYYSIDILDLQIYNRQTDVDHVLVYGESPASNQGTETWHWLTKDLSPFRGEVGQGAKTLSFPDGAVRTKDAADGLAVSKFGFLKDNSTWGGLKILGNPKVKLGDAIEIKNVEKPELNGLFKVISVRHVFNKQQGYLTFVGFSGLGGAEKAASLLGGLAGQLTGALGL